jgi:hypothetical protein
VKKKSKELSSAIQNNKTKQTMKIKAKTSAKWSMVLLHMITSLSVIIPHMLASFSKM